MIEIVAAVVGSGVTIIAMGVTGGIKGNTSNREVVTRLTIAVENIGAKLDDLHEDIKIDRKEMFSRLSAVEQRLTRLETKLLT